MRTLFIVVFMLTLAYSASAQWSEHIVTDSFADAVNVSSGDLDGDGDTDLVGGSLSSVDILWWENTGNGVFDMNYHSISADHVYRTVLAVDFDIDGDVDIVAASLYGGFIAWFPNNGDGTFEEEIIIGDEYPDASKVDTVDFDGDGDIDIFVACFSSDDIAWIENCDTYYVKHEIAGGYLGAHSVYTADFDGDGDVDCVGAADIESSIRWWENDSNTWTPHQVSNQVDGCQFVHVADIDNDGDIDIISSAVDEDQIAWWENEAGVFTEHSVREGFDGAKSVFGEDMNQDGQTDIIACSFFDDSVTIFWNNGDGGSWTEETLSQDFSGATEAFSADIDGDGDLDIYGVANILEAIHWWENPGCPVQLTPGSDPVVVLPGESFDYSVDIELHADNPFFGAIWSEAILPSGYTYGPIYTLSFYFGIETDIHIEGLVQQIPYFAPLGDYEFVLSIGHNSDTPMYSDFFPFSVVGSGARSANTNDQGWVSYGHERLVMSDVETSDASILTGLALNSAYPNPFNPTTTVSVCLPEAAD